MSDDFGKSENNRIAMARICDYRLRERRLYKGIDVAELIFEATIKTNSGSIISLIFDQDQAKKFADDLLELSQDYPRRYIVDSQ